MGTPRNDSATRTHHDGSTATADTGQVYAGPIDIGEGTTTLNYVAVGGGSTSTMETLRPTLLATRRARHWCSTT